MKVLYIVTAYDRHEGDGITPWLAETIRHLRGSGIDVEVLAPSYRGLGTHTVRGVRVHRFRYAPARLETLTHDQTAPDRIRQRPVFLGLVPGYLASASLAARRLVRTGEFDLVHVHWPLPHVVPGWAARAAGSIPLVITFHGVELTFARHSPIPFLETFLRRAITTADAVTANSSYTAGMIRKLHDRPVEIVPFGSTVGGSTGGGGIAPAGEDGAGQSDGLPDPARAALTADGRVGHRILFVGRLVERKGVHVLLDAFERLAFRPELRLDVVGEGPAREELEARAHQLGIADHVRFHGFVSPDELVRHFSTCDLFVLPAVYDAKGDVEGLGVVLVEALSYGRPVVASNAGGITDVIHHGETGILVPPGDAAALAEGMLRILDHPEEAARLASGGRAHVDARFSWPAITARLKELYARLLSEGQHCG